jgi:hypothetical protein|tara:strand:+ start:123 stop:365 length:243 start_codon:yes stop_codon:yes gene_type:complete
MLSRKKFLLLALFPIAFGNLNFIRKKSDLCKFKKDINTSNLYAVSTGIFPTSGGNLPTMNLVAFSLRLADYFRESNGAVI